MDITSEDIQKIIQTPIEDMDDELFKKAISVLLGQHADLTAKVNQLETEITQHKDIIAAMEKRHKVLRNNFALISQTVDTLTTQYSKNVHKEVKDTVVNE